MIGTYRITNRKNGDSLIGTSKDVVKTLRNQKYRLKNNKHTNKKLQSAVNEFKFMNFEFELIEECKLENQFVRQYYWYKKSNHNYNIMVVNPHKKPRKEWTSEQRDEHSALSNARVSVEAYPIWNLDTSEVKRFDSLSQAARALYPEIPQDKATASIRSVINGKWVHFEGWSFKKLENND